ncbi:hypothetical protein [Mucilaginibacter frigoritolerans]|uniref:hypothetical protein n=1 Tax=Mucilaginibacter frigoritolerans TaxID=652788 RepID=UPI0011AA19A5|nr:hypothetical protein [Mucilaginibacter frigoritolerans]
MKNSKIDYRFTDNHINEEMKSHQVNIRNKRTISDRLVKAQSTNAHNVRIESSCPKRHHHV